MPYDETFNKDPDAVLDYSRTWDDWLADGEIISASSWIIAPSGLVKDSDTHNDTQATIWVSSGTNGEIYELTNRIVTSLGRTDDRTFRIYVRER